MALISTFPLAAIRKTKLEIGESALVMGLGILGIFAVQELKAAGAYPIIAVDPIRERREFAMKMGADFAVDPTEENFAKAFKRGTLWGGNPVVMRNLTLTGDGKEQGSLLRGERAEILFSASDIQCGGYAVCISNGEKIARLPIEDGAVSGSWVLRCEQKYNFARVELYNEEDRLIAFSNPIYLVAEGTEIEER